MSFWMVILVGLLIFVGGRCFVVVNTGLTVPGIRAEFMERLNATQAEWPNLSTRIPSTAQTERHRWLGTVPQMRSWTGGRHLQGLHNEAYDIDNGEYELTIEVDRKEIEDDQIGGIRIRISEMAEAAQSHKDYLIEELLNNGSTAGFNGYDGVPFFSAAHPSKVGANQSNMVSVAAATGTSPTRAEFLSSLGEAISKMVAFRDDQGHPRRVKPSGLVCVVPPAMYITALEAVNQTLAGAGLEPTQKNVLQNVTRVITLPGLTTEGRYFLLKTDVSLRPFVFQDRLPIEFTALEGESEEGFLRNKFLYGVRGRYAMAYGYWYYAVQVDFT